MDLILHESISGSVEDRFTLKDSPGGCDLYDGNDKVVLGEEAFSNAEGEDPDSTSNRKVLTKPVLETSVKNRTNQIDARMQDVIYRVCGLGVQKLNTLDNTATAGEMEGSSLNPAFAKTDISSAIISAIVPILPSTPPNVSQHTEVLLRTYGNFDTLENLNKDFISQELPVKMTNGRYIVPTNFKYILTNRETGDETPHDLKYYNIVLRGVTKSGAMMMTTAGLYLDLDAAPFGISRVVSRKAALMVMATINKVSSSEVTLAIEPLVGRADVTNVIITQIKRYDNETDL
jgi:hypothetical protein